MITSRQVCVTTSPGFQPTKGEHIVLVKPVYKASDEVEKGNSANDDSHCEEEGLVLGSVDHRVGNSKVDDREHHKAL